jgi:hypothetical protein
MQSRGRARQHVRYSINDVLHGQCGKNDAEHTTNDVDAGHAKSFHQRYGGDERPRIKDIEVPGMARAGQGHQNDQVDVALSRKRPEAMTAASATRAAVTKSLSAVAGKVAERPRKHVHEPGPLQNAYPT